MSAPRVLMMTLAERTSKAGNAYLSGWLGKARLVGFKAKEPDRFGNEVWEIYASEPEQKDEAQVSRNAERGQSRAAGRAQQAGEAVVREARLPEPPQDWLDDSAAAVADLEGGR